MLELADDHQRPSVRHRALAALEFSSRVASQAKDHAQREPVAMINGLRLAILIGCLVVRLPLKASIPIVLMGDALCTAWARTCVSPTRHKHERRLRSPEPDRTM